jgi:hypothetical protein
MEPGMSSGGGVADMKKPHREEWWGFFLESGEMKLISDAAPHLFGVNFLIRVECPGFLQERLSRFRIGRVGNATVIDRAHRGTLRLVKMADALGAAIVGDDINAVSHALPFTDMVPLALCITPRFKNGLVRAFRQASPAGNAFVGN